MISIVLEQERQKSVVTPATVAAGGVGAGLMLKGATKPAEVKKPVTPATPDKPAEVKKPVTPAAPEKTVERTIEKMKTPPSQKSPTGKGEESGSAFHRTKRYFQKKMDERAESEMKQKPIVRAREMERYTTADPEHKIPWRFDTLALKAGKKIKKAITDD